MDKSSVEHDVSCSNLKIHELAITVDIRYELVAKLQEACYNLSQSSIKFHSNCSTKTGASQLGKNTLVIEIKPIQTKFA
ncbi:hypothetical protein WA1_43220 [Scytonema hofmannii PCC 7110]|uniref:Uncharacterized protein n=1 Tax=Scytonema hofmannii PCC 7110 TaxID=128403 RepID=A0A139WVN8_9CYAN|nr:hypothetical protein WA1_43220 [Scytonema hofmannii PCC 7110]